MPRWDVSSRHEIIVRATPAATMQAVRDLDLGRSPAASLLFRLRGMPRSMATFDGLLRHGFFVLAERPDCEIVLGVAGRFWTLRGGLRKLSPESFRNFNEPGTARATWSFRIDPLADGTVRLSTETRVLCADDASRRKFRLYWLVVGPFSGLIRREALRLIRSRGSRGQSP